MPEHSFRSYSASSPAPLLLVNVLAVTSLLTPFLMAMAFTVVVAVRLKGALYRVLSAVGTLPSVVSANEVLPLMVGAATVSDEPLLPLFEPPPFSFWFSLGEGLPAFNSATAVAMGFKVCTFFVLPLMVTSCVSMMLRSSNVQRFLNFGPHRLSSFVESGR